MDAVLVSLDQLEALGAVVEQHTGAGSVPIIVAVAQPGSTLGAALPALERAQEVLVGVQMEPAAP